MCQFTGFSKRKLLTTNVVDILYGEEKDTFIKNLNRRSEGCKFSYQYKNLFFKTKIGSIKPIFLFSDTIDYEDSPHGFCMAIDRTEDKACEILYKSLSEINQIIMLTDDKDKLLKSVCNALVYKAGFSLAAIGKVNKNTQLYSVEFVSSKEEKYAETLKKLTISVDPLIKEGRGSVAEAYRTKQIAFISDVVNDKRMSAWRKYQKELSVYSACSIPLLKNGEVEYILVVYSSVTDFFTSQHIDLLKELQLDLSFALEKMRTQRDIELFSKAIAKSHEWAVITDKNGKILYANKAVSDISGYDKRELTGKNPNVFKSGYHNRSFYTKLWKTVMSGNEFSCRFVNRAKNGSLFYLDAIIIPIKHNGKVHRLVDLSRDVTKEVLFAKRLEFQANIYNILYRLTNLSVSIKNKDDYLENLLSIFNEYANIDIAFIMSIDKEGLSLKAQTIKSEDYEQLPQISKKFFEKLYFSGNRTAPVFKTLRNGKIYLLNDIVKESCFPFNKLAETYNMGSCCSIPIIQNKSAVSSLVIISKQKNIFDAKLYKLLSIVSRQIEFILNKIEEDKFHNIVLTALNTGFEFVVITDKNFNIVYANKTVQKLSGYTEKELIGKHHSIFSSRKHSKEFAKKFYETLKGGKTFSGIITYKIKNGQLLDFISNIVPYKINNSIEYYIAVGKKLTKKESILKEMERMLHEDRLTGLLNSDAFLKSIERFLINNRYEDSIGAVSIINPLSFKNINEALGFEGGNELLKQIADRLKKNVFELDVIAKLESDRFGLILKDLKNEESSLIASLRILHELIKPYKVGNKTIILSFNVGISLYPKDAVTSKELINKAQIALAEAKSKGENQIGFFRRDFENKASKIIKLRAELETAVKENEFLAYYQPYVDSDRQIAGAEALIRWQKGKKIVSPMDFIPYLEQTNLIVAVENNFSDTVLRYVKKLKASDIEPVPISVNLSAKSLNRKSLFRGILSKLKRYDVEAKYLKIEIIERLFLENFDYLKALIQKFKERGISFSVDDFGTGYSSLSYLAKLPVDYLKIDISFVRAIDSRQTRGVVKSIIFLSKELKIKTIAEGVETKEQFEILKNMGCDYFQGYLFYRPMPDDEFFKLLSLR